MTFGISPHPSGVVQAEADGIRPGKEGHKSLLLQLEHQNGRVALAGRSSGETSRGITQGYREGNFGPRHAHGGDAKSSGKKLVGHLDETTGTVSKISNRSLTFYGPGFQS